CDRDYKQQADCHRRGDGLPLAGRTGRDRRGDRCRTGRHYDYNDGACRFSDQQRATRDSRCAMRVFFLDLWMDLREKRLAPVAIALLAGIIAVPIVLAKSTNPPPPPPATTTTASAPATPVVESQAQVTSSKLQTFSARDPF